MAGFSPKLPLVKSDIDGWMLTKTPTEMVKQNFKMLILTSPGERVMEPEFGVGIRGYLFEQLTEEVFIRIRTRINEQVATYMPYVIILDLTFNSTAQGPQQALDYDENYLGISITYEIETVGVVEVLDVLI
jgi:phage baseplate assembly protein W